VRFDKSNTDPWNPAEPNVAALYAGVPAADQDLLKTASLKAAASNAIAFALGARTLALSRAEVQSRDRDGDLETLARSIEDGL